MSGICIAGGTADAARRVEAMLGRMSGHGQKRGLSTPAPDLAVGRAYRGRLAAEGPPVQIDADLTVLVDGEIFTDDGPLAAPEEHLAALYRNGQADRFAWLNGSFAAIIVDRARRRVVLAGDRLGSRTLFIWHGDKGFAAASRLDALLADDRVPRRLSRQGLIELVALQRTVGDHTQYADVHALRAAELWTFEDGRAERRQTRRLAWSRPDFDEREGGERLAAAMRSATARRTADGVRHGLLLSGGLDARLVLAAARANDRTPSCITAGPFRNAEVAVAEATAERAGAPFRFVEVPPASLAGQLDPATTASDGLFGAPMNLLGMLPALATDHDVLLSGHGLDYTVRGYYLPCRMVRLGGSVTRLPALRAIPGGTPEALAANMRVGIKEHAVRAVLAPTLRDELGRYKALAIAAATENADIDDPYNAWDAYILGCLGRHYAYSDFVAMESVIAHRAITFDPEIFDLYLAMPPSWRASGRMAHAAMVALGPALMDLPDANTGVSARHSFRTQIALVFARAGLRRLGLLHREAPPDPTMSHGSWANLRELLRRDPQFVARLEHLPGCDALMDTGLFSRDGLRTTVAAHLERRADHAKLLLQLLTMASWLERHSYASVDHAGVQLRDAGSRMTA